MISRPCAIQQMSNLQRTQRYLLDFGSERCKKGLPSRAQESRDNLSVSLTASVHCKQKPGSLDFGDRRYADRVQED